MMEINAVAPHILAANILVRVYEPKKLFGLTTCKKRGIQKLGYPIHLMRVGEIKRYLDILVGVLNHDDAVIVNVCVRPFAFEEDGATRLHFSCPELRPLKK